MSEGKKILILKSKRKISLRNENFIRRKLIDDLRDGVVIIPDDFEYEWINENELKQIENPKITFSPLERKTTLWERIKRIFKSEIKKMTKLRTWQKKKKN